MATDGKEQITVNDAYERRRFSTVRARIAASRCSAGGSSGKTCRVQGTLPENASRSALAAHRSGNQSHHEDKVAVNTLIQRIDDIRRFDGRILVILCTNRYEAIDPAILRRAAYVEDFPRPDDGNRREILNLDCKGLGF